jgi:hypothetical protein
LSFRRWRWANNGSSKSVRFLGCIRAILKHKEDTKIALLSHKCSGGSPVISGERIPKFLPNRNFIKEARHNVDLSGRTFFYIAA